MVEISCRWFNISWFLIRWHLIIWFPIRWHLISWFLIRWHLISWFLIRWNLSAYLLSGDILSYDFRSDDILSADFLLDDVLSADSFPSHFELYFHQILNSISIQCWLNELSFHFTWTCLVWATSTLCGYMMFSCNPLVGVLQPLFWK